MRDSNQLPPGAARTQIASQASGAANLLIIQSEHFIFSHHSNPLTSLGDTLKAPQMGYTPQITTLAALPADVCDRVLGIMLRHRFEGKARACVA